jgi:hypothetical protein
MASNGFAELSFVIVIVRLGNSGPFLRKPRLREPFFGQSS